MLESTVKLLGRFTLERCDFTDRFLYTSARLLRPYERSAVEALP
jgi:hypothetical protein